MAKVILAVLAPFLMIIFLTRVTFNHYISTLLTIGVIFAIFKGYGEPTFVTATWIFSVIAGFFVASKMRKNLKKANRKKY
ncbi:MAG TPA: DUF2198 family protein [Bacillus bacterium]|nr:DUF2198 family protein [Bacillus sp. (in: firmicutes)]